jgi:PAS domain S-box-containing protein
MATQDNEAYKPMQNKPSHEELEQKQAEKERDALTENLKETSNLLNAVLDAIPDVIGVQDINHRILRYNEAGYRFLGMTPTEVIGKKCYQLIGQSDPCQNCATSKVYKSKKPEQVEKYVEELDKWLDVRAYPLLDEDGTITRVIEHLRDITEDKHNEMKRLRMERQLQHAQKLESLGTLAGGVAHDFNNLLMGIQGRASLMSIELKANHQHHEHISAIMEYIKSATDLTKQLLGIAHGGKYEVRAIEINDLVEKGISMFGRTKKEIRIYTKYTDPSMVVVVDRSQIEQALLNIYVNAWQAMPKGGELYVETSAVSLDGAFCKPHNTEPGPYVKISVTDTGIGMSEATRQRVFDPFFTTKKKGRGTGLGLASAYGIIKNHEGIITVDSSVGEGSSFNIFLPVSDQKVEQEKMANNKVIKGTEIILLVDDEQIIRDVGKAMLEKLGYQVITVDSGEGALDIVKEKGEKIDIVLLDMIMPGLDGGKTFDQIRKLQPAMPVILSSGYSINGQANDIMSRGCNGFIQKPFHISELSQKIRATIGPQKP